MKGSELVAVLLRKPLSYRIVRQEGSHRLLRSHGRRPQLRLSWHDQDDLGGVVVKKLLVDKVGLTEQEALSLL